VLLLVCAAQKKCCVKSDRQHIITSGYQWVYEASEFYMAIISSFSGGESCPERKHAQAQLLCKQQVPRETGST